MTLTAGYTAGHFEFDVSVNNVLNSRKTVSITENDAAYNPNQLASTNQLFFQAPTSIMFTLKTRY